MVVVLLLVSLLLALICVLIPTPIGYYTTLLNSVGAPEFSPLPKPHNSTATSPIYLSQPSPLSIRKGDSYGPRIKKSVGVFSTYERVIGGSWCVTGVESHLSHLKFHEYHFTMALKKCVGIGAECTVSLRFLHPKNKVKATIPNQMSTQKLSSLIVQSKEKKTVHHEEKDCIVFWHEDFNKPIWCLSSYVKVDVKGPEETFFPLETRGGGGGGQAAQEGATDGSAPDSIVN